MRRTATAAGETLPAIEKLGRRPPLDGLRGLAAISVILVHSRVAPFVSGQVGVDMFFVLSGFLITSVLLEQIAHGRYTYAKFLERRARRLLPAYFVVMLSALVIEQIWPMGGTEHGAFLGFFYVANWWQALTGGGLGLLGHTWALQIEEQFYVLWPLLLVALIIWTRGRLPRLAAAIIGIGCVSIAARFFLWGTGASWQRIEFGTDTRVASLLFGCAAGVLLARSRAAFTGRTARAWNVAGIAALVALATGTTFSLEEGNTFFLGMSLKWPAVTAIALVAIVAVVRVPDGSAARFLSNRPLMAVAEISYGLYLWHFLVLAELDQHFGLQHWWVRITGWALTAALAVASYKLIEQPALHASFASITARFRRSAAPSDADGALNEAA
ncbi:MAG: acyltransferase family protein [Acidimicrobiia bacterium]